MASPGRRKKNLSTDEIQALLTDLEKYKKDEEKEKKKHEQQLRKDTQSNKKKITREVQMASKEVRKKEMEVKKLQQGMAKVEQQEEQNLQKKAQQNQRLDEGIARLRKKFQDLEMQLVAKVEESGKAHGWLAHVEFAQQMLEQTGKLLETEVDPNFELQAAQPIEDAPQPLPEPPQEVVQEKMQLQKRTTRLHQENERLRREILENRRIVQALEDSTNRFVAKRKAQAEETPNGAESPKPSPLRASPAASPKTRPVMMGSAISVGDLRYPSYPGPSIRLDPQGSYPQGTNVRVSASPVSYNRGGYNGGYASRATFTTAVGYSGQSATAAPSYGVGTVINATEVISNRPLGGLGMVRPYSLPQLPTLAQAVTQPSTSGGPLASPVTSSSFKPSATGLGSPVSVGPGSSLPKTSVPSKATYDVVSPTPPQAPPRPEPAPRQGGNRLQNAVRKVQAQALREYRDIIANDSNEMTM